MSDDTRRPAYALLKLDTVDGPVWFVMDHPRWMGAGESHEEWQHHDEFFFNEHSCPTNWIGKCVAIIHDGDYDPHGLLEYVRSVEVDTTKYGQDEEPHESEWAEIFPEVTHG